MDVWDAIGEAKPSPRDEVIYDIEPFRAAVRKGDWKLIWRTALPSRIELFNIAQDPGERTDLAAKYPDKVAELQRIAEAQARSGVPPLLFQESFALVKEVQMTTVALPGDDKVIEAEP